MHSTVGCWCLKLMTNGQLAWHRTLGILRKERKTHNSIGIIRRWSLGVFCREKSNSDLAFLNRRLGGFLDVLPLLELLIWCLGLGYKHKSSTTSGTYDRRHVGVFMIWGDGDGLDEEFIAAFGIQRRVLLHRLQQDYFGPALERQRRNCVK